MISSLTIGIFITPTDSVGVITGCLVPKPRKATLTLCAGFLHSHFLLFDLIAPCLHASEEYPWRAGKDPFATSSRRSTVKLPLRTQQIASLYTLSFRSRRAGSVRVATRIIINGTKISDGTTHTIPLANMAANSPIFCNQALHPRSSRENWETTRSIYPHFTIGISA